MNDGFWGFVYNLLRGILTGPQTPLSITATAGLDSGYSVEKDRTIMRLKLRDICDKLVNDPTLMRRYDKTVGEEETFCNVAVRRGSSEMGCGDFNPSMTADVMYDVMAAGGSGWRKDTAERAHIHAWRGGLAVAAHKYEGHGHVAIIYPMDHMGISPSWGKQVPYVANVGHVNQIMLASEAFPVHKGEPDYFLYGDV